MLSQEGCVLEVTFPIVACHTSLPLVATLVSACRGAQYVLDQNIGHLKFKFLVNGIRNVSFKLHLKNHSIDGFVVGVHNVNVDTELIDALYRVDLGLWVVHRMKLVDWSCFNDQLDLFLVTER